MEKDATLPLGDFTNVHVFHQLQLDVEMFDVVLYKLCQLSV